MIYHPAIFDGFMTFLQQCLIVSTGMVAGPGSAVIKGLSVVRKGLFRTKLPVIGECARVDMSAGDAAPYLERDMYMLLGFEPHFDQLPEEPPSNPEADRLFWPEWR